MNTFQWCLLIGTAGFVAACLWAWEELDRIDRDHWYQIAAKRHHEAQPHLKKGAPQGSKIARAHSQNQRDAQKESVPPCDS